MLSFSERMQQGRDLAQVQRNRGQPVGKPAAGWNVKRPNLTGLDAIEAYYQQWRRDIHYWGVIAVQEALFADELEDIRRWL
jgi:hypothetical protein